MGRLILPEDLELDNKLWPQPARPYRISVAMDEDFRRDGLNY